MSDLKEKNIQPFERGVIQGVQVRPLKKHRDDRGWLMELFRADEIDSDMMPAMSYVSETLPGVTRGPHEHVKQTDYFCFLGPSTFRLAQGSGWSMVSSEQYRRVEPSRQDCGRKPVYGD